MTLDGELVRAKGKLGENQVRVGNDVVVTMDADSVAVQPANDTRQSRNMWGTARSLVEGLVKGVSEGFVINLELIGVGYRGAMRGNTLVLQLGFSHEVNHPIPDGITIICERPTLVSVRGIDKRLVGQVAAEIRAYRPPEPYKGKGVKYENETVLRKEGKKK
jgi:large subunit ribosomal protein L6